MRSTFFSKPSNERRETFYLIFGTLLCPCVIFAIVAILIYLFPLRPLTTEDLADVRIDDLSFLSCVVGGAEKLPELGETPVYLLLWRPDNNSSTKEIQTLLAEHEAEFAEYPERFILVAAKVEIIYSMEIDSGGPSNSKGVTYIEEVPPERCILPVLKDGMLPFKTVWRDRADHITTLLGTAAKAAEKGWWSRPAALRIKNGRVSPEY